MLNWKEKAIIWLVISGICSVIGGIIGGTIFNGFYPEWIGWGALIGFVIPTVMLSIIEGT